MRITQRAKIAIIAGCLAPGALLWACDDAPTGGGLELGFDASSPSATADRGIVTAVDSGARPVDARPDVDVDVAAPPPDGGVDAASLPESLRGVWHGTGYQANATWSILADIHGGDRGGVVGVITYPSLACGGTLVWASAPDGGAGDAGEPEDARPDGGDAGLASITLHESVSAGCVQEGEDTFTLLANGDLFYEYRVTSTTEIAAFGTLKRLGAPGQATPFSGVWHSGDLNASNLRPLLASVSSGTADAGAAGVFLLADESGTHACAAHWVVGGGTAQSLVLTEVFGDEQTLCLGPGTAALTRAGDGLVYTRDVADGGRGSIPADAGLVMSRF